jgi:PAS domain S-box-containing protein
MLFYKSPLPKWIYDEDTLRFLEVNDAAVRLYGYSEEEFQQLTLADIRLKEDAEERSRAGQWRHIRKDGEVIDVEVTAHALELDGRRARMMAVVDVTERRRHELELQVMNADLAKRAEAVIVAQEKERTEIGKELHDNVNQILGASNLYINTAMTDEEMRQELLERSTELVSNAINEIRKISKSLITPGLREIGLIESIEDIIDDLKVAGDRLTIDLDLQNIAEEQIEERRKLTVFRIVQEQLNNIVKHARATRVLVRLSGERDHIVLTVADNGVGFDVSRHRKGVGITNIISRAELFNGRVEIQSMPGEGCVLTVSLPM